MKSWILLLIPPAALFIWYWGFFRNLDSDKSQQDLSKTKKGSNFIDNGFEVKQVAGKRYIQRSKSPTGKKDILKKSKKISAKKRSTRKKP